MAIRIKTKDQIEGVRKACKFAAQTLDWIAPQVVAGVSTKTLNDLIHQYTLDYGAIPAPLGYKGFPASACTSINEVICHGIPSESDVLKDGDIINIDVTPIVNGYYGDTSRMFTIGEVSPQAKNLLDVTRQALAVGIKQVKPGNRFSQIGYAIACYAIPCGYSIVETFGGHGVGVDFHEEPYIRHYSDSPNEGQIMKPGMIFTIEPMLCAGGSLSVTDEDKWTARTADKSLSAQEEHTVLVSKTGYEILTV